MKIYTRGFLGWLKNPILASSHSLKLPILLSLPELRISPVCSQLLICAFANQILSYLFLESTSCSKKNGER